MPSEPDALRQAAPRASAPIATIDVARARLARELRGLPPWGSAPLLRQLLAPPTPISAPPSATPPAPSVSSGALVHYVRLSRRLGATHAAADLFVALLTRSEGPNRRWAARTVASAPIEAADAPTIREDLRQELTLRLWERIGREDGEAWELFFQRALTFEQRHVASAFMTRNGYWRDPHSQTPTRGLTILLSRLTSAPADGRSSTTAATDLPTLVASVTRGADASPEPPDILDPHDLFTAANLADLRRLVMGLPDRERVAVTLRFWYGASEAEIAAALAGVTTRTVRTILHSAYARLRHGYQPDAVNTAADSAQGRRRGGASDGQHADEGGSDDN